jgi:hypothetical protein
MLDSRKITGERNGSRVMVLQPHAAEAFERFGFWKTTQTHCGLDSNTTVNWRRPCWITGAERVPEPEPSDGKPVLAGISKTLPGIIVGIKSFVRSSKSLARINKSHTVGLSYKEA